MCGGRTKGYCILIEYDCIDNLNSLREFKLREVMSKVNIVLHLVRLETGN